MICLLCGRYQAQNLSLLALLTGRDEPASLCLACEQRFVSLVNEHVCRGCGRLFQGDDLCGDCVRWSDPLLMNRALFQYNDAFKEFMQRYKFEGDYRLRAVFSACFGEFVQEQGADVIVPIPVSEHTDLTRGFNQVLGLLGDVAYTSLLAVQAFDKQQQSHGDRKMRMTKANPFVLETIPDLTDKTVLLVDDVYTTGRTLYHARALIATLNPKNIKSVTLAR